MARLAFSSISEPLALHDKGLNDREIRSVVVNRFVERGQIYIGPERIATRAQYQRS